MKKTRLIFSGSSNDSIMASWIKTRLEKHNTGEKILSLEDLLEILKTYRFFAAVFRAEHSNSLADLVVAIKGNLLLVYENGRELSYTIEEVEVYDKGDVTMTGGAGPDAVCADSIT